MLRSKNHSLRILRNAGGGVLVNEVKKLKNDHNLDKCQHKGNEIAERRLLHIASKGKAQQ